MRLPPTLLLVLPLALGVLPAAGLLAAELGAGDVARVDGTVLTEPEFCRFVANEYRGSDAARSALDDLIDEQVVLVEAERRGLRVSGEDLDARFAQYAKRYADTVKGDDFESYLAREEIDRDLFRATLRPVLLLEQCARQDFDLGAREAVPEEKMHLWLQDRRSKAVIDTEGLNGGTIARVDGVPITDEQFGRRLIRHEGRAKAAEWLDEFIGVHLIEHAAAERDIRLTDPEIDRAVDAWEQEYRARRGAGVALRDILEQRGLSRERMRTSRLLRAKLLMERLTDELWPETELHRLYEEHRAEFEDRVGRTAHARLIYLKAGAPGAVETGFVPRGYDDAARTLTALRQSIQAGTLDFAAAAKARSEHPSAERGGDVGTVRAGGTQMPGVLVSRALEATQGANGLAGPLRFPEGEYLVELSEVSAAPSYEALRPLVRARARADLYNSLKEAARIERRE